MTIDIIVYYHEQQDGLYHFFTLHHIEEIGGINFIHENFEEAIIAATKIVKSLVEIRNVIAENLSEEEPITLGEITFQRFTLPNLKTVMAQINRTKHTKLLATSFDRNIVDEITERVLVTYGYKVERIKSSGKEVCIVSWEKDMEESEEIEALLTL